MGMAGVEGKFIPGGIGSPSELGELVAVEYPLQERIRWCLAMKQMVSEKRRSHGRSWSSTFMEMTLEQIVAFEVDDGYAGSGNVRMYVWSTSLSKK